MERLNDRLETLDQSHYVRLLEHAASAFARYGYDGASVRAITEAAAMNPAMVAYYFQSKAGLFQTVLDDRRAQIHHRLAWAEKAADPLAGPEVRRRAYLHCVLVDFPEFLHLLWSHAWLAGDGFPYAVCRKLLLEQPAIAAWPELLGELAGAVLVSDTPLMDRPETERQALAEGLAPARPQRFASRAAAPKRKPKPKPAPPEPPPPESTPYRPAGDDFLDGFVD